MVRNINNCFKTETQSLNKNPNFDELKPIQSVHARVRNDPLGFRGRCEWP